MPATLSTPSLGRRCPLSSRSRTRCSARHFSPGLSFQSDCSDARGGSAARIARHGGGIRCMRRVYPLRFHRVQSTSPARTASTNPTVNAAPIPRRDARLRRAPQRTPRTGSRRPVRRCLRCQAVPSQSNSRMPLPGSVRPQRKPRRRGTTLQLTCACPYDRGTRCGGLEWTSGWPPSQWSRRPVIACTWPSYSRFHAVSPSRTARRTFACISSVVA